MQGITAFLNSHSQSPFSSSDAKIFKFTLGNRSLSGRINDKMEVSFEQLMENKSFTFKPTCMLFPTFNGAQVTRISIHEGYSMLNIDHTDADEIAYLYSRMTRFMSHKGFSDFYKPIKRLGRGNFATVYLIEHKHTHIRKAAKVFSRVGQGMEFMGKQALENEIKTLREINHPNIIKYDGLYETESLVYLVTEYLSGGTLEEALKTKSMHTGQFIQSILKDLLSGLAYLDSKHIMHRDIKPENVILREEDNRWVIGDFGLAARSNEDYFYDKCGTMGYMAPEILKLNENQKYMQSCDIYSLGVIAYQLIVGELPFKVQAENMFDKKIVWILFDREQCKRINPSILDFLKELLESEPKSRISPKKALHHPFFTDQKVVGELFTYHEKRRAERYDRILKMANIN